VKYPATLIYNSYRPSVSVQRRAGLIAVACEVVPLANVFGPFPACEQQLIEGNVADQVERIEVLADFIRERVKQDAMFFKFFDDGLLPVSSQPSLRELVQCRKFLIDPAACVVFQRFRDEFACLGIKVLDTLGSDADFHVADVILLWFAAARWKVDVPARRFGVHNDRATRSIVPFFVGTGFRFIRRDGRIIRSRFVDADGRTVEVAIGEQFRRLLEVMMVKKNLP